MADWRQSSILAQLRGEIVDGQYAPGMLLPTRDVLQARFGVSRHTVQGAMQTLIREGFATARRGDGSYVAERPPHLFHYGLVSAEQFSSSRYAAAIQQAAERLAAAGPLSFSTYCYDRGHVQSAGYRQLLVDVQTRRLAGLIFVTPPYRLEGTPMLEQAGLPRVMTSAPEGYQQIPRIVPDLTAFRELAVNHLLSQERRRIAVIASHLQPQHLEADLDFFNRRCGSRPEWLQSCSCAQPWSARQAARLLASLPAAERPDGLIVADDHLLEAAAEGLAAAGLQIPHDLQVVAHANFPNLPPAGVPVVHLGFDCTELVRRCLQSLDAQRQGTTVPHEATIAPVFEPQAAERASPPSSSSPPA